MARAKKQDKEREAEDAGNAPAPGTRQRRERRMAAAEWDKVHSACVRAERHPDPTQTAAFDLDALTVRVGSDET